MTQTMMHLGMFLGPIAPLGQASIEEEDGEPCQAVEEEREIWEPYNPF